MLSMDQSDGGPTSRAGSAGRGGPCITARILRAEEQTSVLMQRFTAYVIAVSDFGQTNEVAHRYGDFETLHKALLTDVPGLQLPPMPPKGLDGTDAAVVATRKVELEKILGAMLRNPEVLTEKQLHVWKFLNLPNPAVIAARFITCPGSRPTTLKTLAKLNDPKYKDDVYRLGHPAMTDLLLEGLRELRGGDLGSSHWCRQTGGRTAVCHLLASAMGTDAARTRLLEADVHSLLLGLVEREEDALDDARAALNVIVAREADRFSALLAGLLRKGGLSQLAVLAQRPKCQEFVAKLLWLAWDAPARAPFAQPGGQGLKLLQALLRSPTPACSLLGAVLLAGLIAGGAFDAEAEHRMEALRLVRGVLEVPEAAADPQFAKTLCGSQTALVRLAGLLEDVDLAPLILGLICAAKPPPAKLGGIVGNLASLVNQRSGASHSEETRAKAAELLLHIQGGGSGTAGGGGTGGGGIGQAGAGAGAISSSAPPPPLELERCEGIADHEESLDRALRTQFEDAIRRSQQELASRATAVGEAKALAQHRLKALPSLDFRTFDNSFTSFKTARESLDKVVRETEDLHRSIERQLLDFRIARPSSVDPQSFRDRLLAVERLYADVKGRRETLATVEAEAREKASRAQASSESFKRTAEELRRVEEEAHTLRLQRTEKETEATKLRHKASMPSLQSMKQQAQENIDRNMEEAKKLQVIGQRVQQGDPDYLKEGENRDQKIAELAAKLASLKKQHQQLMKEQKELDFDPEQLNVQASRMEAEAREVASRLDTLESRRLEAERERTTSSSASHRDAEEARLAEDRRSSLAASVKAAEQEVSAQLSSLQPMIQEHHAGWQRLLGQQKKLDTDHRALGAKLEEARRTGELEAGMRSELLDRIHEVALGLHGLRTFLEEVGSEPPSAPPPAADVAAARAPPLSAAPGGSCEESVPTLVASPGFTAPSSTEPTAAVAAEEPEAPSLSSAPPPMDDDDFETFLREGPAATFGSGTGGTAVPDVAEGDPF